MPTCRRFLLLALALGLAGLSRQPRAYADESAAAVSLFDEGNRLYEAGSFAQACPKYEASLRLDASSIDTRGRLALCYEKTGRLASAWSAWREVKSRAGRSLGRERAVDIATSHIADLEPKLARVTLELAAGVSAPPGLSVTMDGAAFPVESFGVGVAVDKGAHRVEASAPGFVAWSTSVTVDDGERKSVPVGPFEAQKVVTPPPPVPGAGAPAVTGAPAAPMRAPRHVSSVRKWVGIGILVAGVGVLGVGGLQGLDAMTKRDDAVKAGCHDDLTHCPNPAALDTAHNAYSAANLATGIIIGGSALALTGIIVWATAPSSSDDVPERTAWRVTPSLGSSGAGVVFSGAF